MDNQPENNPPRKRRFKIKFDKKWWLEIILTTIIGILLTELLVGLKTLNPSYKFIQTEDKPVLVGIYPKDGFGIDQKRGLVESHVEFGTNVDLVHLDYLTISQMKSNDIASYTEHLKDLLDNRNVLGLVGPSITESSVEIIKTVKDNKPHIPIFLMTAASKNYLDWENSRKKTPLFRLCTDIDLRSKEISGFIKKMTELEKEVVFIVERSAGKETYGDQFLSTIKREYGETLFARHERAQKIKIQEFDRENIDREVTQQRFSDLFDTNSLVLFLGIGGQFKTFIDSHYTVDKNPKAYFGGWLNSYAYYKDLEDGKYHSDKIFEISDFNLNAYNFSDSNLATDVFLSSGGKKEPPYRDFALGFDAGLVVLKSFQEVSKETSRYMKVNRYASDKIIEKVMRANGGVWKGVTGEISFTPIGENIRSINFAKYNGNDWEVLNNINELLDEDIQE